MSVSTVFKNLIAVFNQNANANDAVQMSAYMKDQFEFYGIKSIQRRALTKTFITKKNKPSKSDAFALVEKLWNDKHRELQYVAMEIMDWYVKELDEKDIKFIEELILKRAWWDTVDFIASHLVGAYFNSYLNKRDNICKRWSNSNSIWLQRTVILFQLNYKDKTDEKFLFQYCNKHAPQNEFFIRKAIGWALRQYSKTNPKAVRNFIKNTNLSPLSIKEGSKYI